MHVHMQPARLSTSLFLLLTPYMYLYHPTGRVAVCCAAPHIQCVVWIVDVLCPMSLVWLELLELMKGRSGVALTRFSSSSYLHVTGVDGCRAGGGQLESC